MTPRPIAAAILAATLIAAPATSEAAPTPTPNASSKLIVVGKSIGGLKLGGTYAAMTKTWGKPNACAADKSSCSYFAKAGGATAIVRFTGGTISTLQLRASPKDHSAGTLSIYRDEIGVRLGLKSLQLPQAYPTGAWHSSSVFVVPGPGTGETVFETTKGKITNLMVRIAPDKLG